MCALGYRGLELGEVSEKKEKKKHSQLEYEENEACGLGCFSNQWFCDTFFRLQFVLHVVNRARAYAR